MYLSFSGGKDSGVLLNACVEHIRQYGNEQEFMPEARKLEPAGIAFGRPARLVPG